MIMVQPIVDKLPEIELKACKTTIIVIEHALTKIVCYFVVVSK